MRTRYFIRKLVTYKIWLYLTNCVLWTLVYLGPVLAGLVVREFFDSLGCRTIARASAQRCC